MLYSNENEKEKEIFYIFLEDIIMKSYIKQIFGQK